MEKLYIIGCGPGGEELLTNNAKSIIERSARVLGTGRLGGLTLAELNAELRLPSDGATVIRVSGDCGFYSAAKSILRDFAGAYDIELIPGISSIQYFSAKIRVPYDDAALVSLHGRSANIAAKTAYNHKVFALTGGANKIRGICRTLCRAGLGEVSVTVGERLSYPDERITSGSAEHLCETNFDELAVMYIENPAAVNPHIPLTDNDFVRGAVPMTKEEVRWISLQKLGVEPSDTVYDIGAGTGSVAVEMARRVFDGYVYAVEVKPEACELIHINAAKHGAFNVEVVQGEAPSALDGLPAPDKVFIGGSSGNMDSILEMLVSRNPNIKITANAVTLQTLGQITGGFEKYGFADVDIVCVNIAKSRKIGGFDMMTAQNPVYIITGTRREQ